MPFVTAFRAWFLDRFERKHIFSFLKGLLLTYLGLNDDIFFIWAGSKERVFPFWIQKGISRTTNFTRKYIENKPNERASFIQIQNIRDRILYSQALRIKRICTTLNITAKSLSDFVSRVITQSYWPSTLKQLRKELIKNYKKRYANKYTHWISNYISPIFTKHQ